MPDTYKTEEIQAKSSSLTTMYGATGKFGTWCRRATSLSPEIKEE